MGLYRNLSRGGGELNNCWGLTICTHSNLILVLIFGTFRDLNTFLFIIENRGKIGTVFTLYSGKEIYFPPKQIQDFYFSTFF